MKSIKGFKGKKIEELNFIEIVGAKEHNLKNVTIQIPKKSLVVVTGVSGSGKSSLVFDTIFAEGQRRYVESLSAYARQFLGQMEKPKYETIRGLSPTIAIEQKAASKNPRSTVGTITEVSDYLRVLYARVGVQHCITCGKIVGAGSSESIVKDIVREYTNKKISILAPLIDNRKGEHKDVIAKIKADGFLRARVDGVMAEISGVQTLEKNKKHTIEAVVDRMTLDSASKKKRLNDSIELALKQGKGKVIIHEDEGKEKLFNTERTCCGIAYPELEPSLFSFNTPKGMCETCHGIGSSITIDPKKVVGDETLSIAHGAIKPWDSYFENGRSKGQWWGSAKYFNDMQRIWGLSFTKPWKDLGKEMQDLVLYGSDQPKKYLQGEPYGGVSQMIIESFKANQEKGEEKDGWADKYIMYTKCQDCNGTRLNPIVRAVTVKDVSFPTLSDMSILDSHDFITKLKFDGTNEKAITEELLKEIKSRLGFLVSVGLEYLSLSRGGNTLSGGEAQRIRLASQIGSELTGVLYVLDEPSIGLHQKDNQKLIDTLKHLRDIGNSVLVVEHDEETMMESDYLIDMGPGAGKYGGDVIAKGTPQQVMKNPKSLTGKYLTGKMKIDIPEKRRTSTKYIEIVGAKSNNLKNVSISIPLETFTCITGVSGAGKSTLINHILFPAISNELHHSSYPVGEHKSIKGMDHIDKVINIDQKPIGKTPRSNPATYTKLFDHIRDLFASLPESKARGYDKGRYSFNVKGGRCEHCQGGGFITVEMHFLADVLVVCDVCHGKRFNESTLEVKFKDLSIADVLDLPVDNAMEVFQNQPRIRKILSTIQEVGLGYIALGQSATTLSGGEAQRIKLSRELAKRDTGGTLYILDEPTTGLHFEDIRKLLGVLHTLVDKKNSVVVIEHNLDVIKTADYIIDVGPKGGAGGGKIIAQGTPEEVAKVKESFTGEFLAKILK